MPRSNEFPSMMIILKLLSLSTSKAMMVHPVSMMAGKKIIPQKEQWKLYCSSNRIHPLHCRDSTLATQPVSLGGAQCKWQKDLLIFICCLSNYSPTR
jgi:hypothetical protein